MVTPINPLPTLLQPPPPCKPPPPLPLLVSRGCPGGLREGWALKGGAPPFGAPPFGFVFFFFSCKPGAKPRGPGGAPKGGGPEGWGPRRVGAPKGGAPKGGGPEGWGPKGGARRVGPWKRSTQQPRCAEVQICQRAMDLAKKKKKGVSPNALMRDVTNASIESIMALRSLTLLASFARFLTV